MPDRLHPAAHGYEIWANAVLPYLNHALTAKDGEELLFPSTFAPRVKSEVTGAHTMPAIPMATFGMRWWGEFADRPLETMKKIADNPVVQVDEKGVTNRWFDVVMVGDSITHRWERSGCGGEETWALLTNRYAVLNLGYGGDSTARSRGRCSPICCIRRRRAIAPGMTGSCRPFVSWSENEERRTSFVVSAMRENGKLTRLDVKRPAGSTEKLRLKVPGMQEIVER